MIAEPPAAAAANARCWSCDRRIDPADRYCRFCGQGQGGSVAWYYRPVWIILLAATALGPFAILLVMRSPLLGRGAKWVLSIAILVFFVYVGWRMIVDVQDLLDTSSELLRSI